jgi:hypothetical protein
MEMTAAVSRQIPYARLAIAGVALAILAGGLIYLNRPAPPVNETGPASEEARAYVPNLSLSDVTMKASENLVAQRVVEIEGHITNKGDRGINAISLYCLFRDVNGREVYRERVPVLQSANRGALRPGETKAFRLPFDTLPDSWNQAVPNLAIAQIQFTK